MTDTTAETLSVIIEREFPHPPEKIWRALTQPHLIAEWLMQNDFAPALHHRFSFRTTPYGSWNGIVDCEVVTIEPNKALAYTWGSGDGALRVATVVSWILTPTAAGTHLRMEQSGFRPNQPQNYQGAKYGWQNFFAKLEQLLARTE